MSIATYRMVKIFIFYKSIEKIIGDNQSVIRSENVVRHKLSWGSNEIKMEEKITFIIKNNLQDLIIEIESSTSERGSLKMDPTSNLNMCLLGGYYFYFTLMKTPKSQSGSVKSGSSSQKNKSIEKYPSSVKNRTIHQSTEESETKFEIEILKLELQKKTILLKCESDKNERLEKNLKEAEQGQRLSEDLLTKKEKEFTNKIRESEDLLTKKEKEFSDRIRKTNGELRGALAKIEELKVSINLLELENTCLKKQLQNSK